MSVTLEVRKLLEKADHALEVAEELKRKNYHSDAASKVYYAMFYAAQALLKSEEIDVKKHSEAATSRGEQIQCFSLLFVPFFLCLK